MAGLGTLGGLAATGTARAGTPPSAPAKGCVGVLVDTTECIGCRKCEWACNEANTLTDKPLEHFEDMSVYEGKRRTTPDAFTVVNRFENPDNPEKPIFVKSQCMHCLEPACVSACLVTAFEKADNGAVVYDAGECLGCRYCMVACPFQIPTYQYDKPLTPEVRKCTFCFDRLTKEGRIPACAEMCPPMCLTFGDREELLGMAHEKIAARPDRYHPKVYGEHEVGGTAWLYLTSRPFEELDFLTLGDDPIPRLTETIQHSVLKMGLPPLLLFGVLGAAMSAFREKDGDGSGGSGEDS